jgi:hypothetical protein
MPSFAKNIELCHSLAKFKELCRVFAKNIELCHNFAYTYDLDITPIRS